MKELITITEKDGQKAVSARELYDYLGYDKSQWARWYQKNIINNDFALENTDYQSFRHNVENLNGGRPTLDFALSIDFAKKLSMMARTEKGETARNYFIEIEKAYRNQKIKELPEEIIDFRSSQIFSVHRIQNEYPVRYVNYEGQEIFKLTDFFYELNSWVDEDEQARQLHTHNFPVYKAWIISISYPMWFTTKSGMDWLIRTHPLLSTCEAYNGFASRPFIPTLYSNSKEPNITDFYNIMADLVEVIRPISNYYTKKQHVL